MPDKYNTPPWIMAGLLPIYHLYEGDAGFVSVRTEKTPVSDIGKLLF